MSVGQQDVVANAIARIPVNGLTSPFAHESKFHAFILVGLQKAVANSLFCIAWMATLSVSVVINH